MPPNGQGLAALEMLNILETVPLGQKDSGFGSTKALHAMIEAKKLAYADLAKYVGDPRKQKLPVATLLSKTWATERAKLILSLIHISRFVVDPRRSRRPVQISRGAVRYLGRRV